MSVRTSHLFPIFLGALTVSALVSCSDASSLEGVAGSVRTSEHEVIYDSNSYQEVGNLPYWDSWFVESRSTAALMKRDKLSCDGERCELEWFPHLEGQVGSRMLPLCSDEPFRGQPVASSCTGFLVGKDLMATAGHCVKGANWCEDVAIVFDYTVNTKNGEANTTFDTDREVYYCSEVIAQSHEGSEIEDNDFAVFRLDRDTRGRAALPLRSSGAIPQYASVDTLANPLGLPLKLEDGGYVRHTSPGLPRFEATIDAAPGSSGGPVFNQSTGDVEGIVVDGPSEIYELGTEEDGSDCARSLQCSGWDGCSGSDHPWVLVSRIERVVEVLEDRSCFDGEKNAQETDVDCGGPDCKPCDPGSTCQQDTDCGEGYRPPSCHAGYCLAGTCEVDTSSCECQDSSDCDDDDPCTRDHCGRNVCYHYDGQCD